VDNRAAQVVYRPVYNTQPEPLPTGEWQAFTYKFSTQLQGKHKYFQLNSFLNYGTNIKFPNQIQQLSLPRAYGPYQRQFAPHLQPERNRSIDLGLDVIRETDTESTALNGWKVNLTYFQNYYQNKFRVYYEPGMPVGYFDNVQNASISGLETSGKIFMWQSKISLELGSSVYHIMEKSAFPFKSAVKVIGNLQFDHAGYSLAFNGYSESEQVGWVRSQNGAFYEISLPGHSDLDMHLGKIFEISRLKFITNFTVRNLFSDDTKLEGLNIRDRRYYISAGIEL